MSQKPDTEALKALFAKVTKKHGESYLHVFARQFGYTRNAARHWLYRGIPIELRPAVAELAGVKAEVVEGMHR